MDFIFRLIFVFSLVLVFFICGVMFSARHIFGEIQPETVDRQTFVQLLMLRDFRSLPQPLAVRLMKRAEKEFGSGAEHPPQFQFSPLKKRVILHFQKNRNNKPSRLENNLNRLAKEQYILWINDYESASKEQKMVLIKKYVAELKYWQSIYFNYIETLGLPPPTLLQSAEEFNKMVVFFKEGESAETVVRIDRFTRELNRHLIAGGIQDAVKEVFPFFRKSKVTSQE